MRAISRKSSKPQSNKKDYVKEEKSFNEVDKILEKIIEEKKHLKSNKESDFE